LTSQCLSIPSELADRLLVGVALMPLDQEPGAATHTAMCSVDIEFGVVVLQTFPGPIKKSPLR